MNQGDRCLEARYIDIFASFLKIGAFTIGGGWAMVPIIEHEMVEKKGWIEKEEFVDLLAIAQTAPGLIAANISIVVGYRLRGTTGSLVAVLGSILPSFTIILTVVMFLSGYRDLPAVEKVLKGIRPAVVALIAVPVITTARAAKVTWHTSWIPILFALSLTFLSMSPIYVIIVASIGGIAYMLWKGGIK
ncbi:MAG: chromate transporter [Bacteroidales bacterium]